MGLKGQIVREHGDFCGFNSGWETYCDGPVGVFPPKAGGGINVRVGFSNRSLSDRDRGVVGAPPADSPSTMISIFMGRPTETHPARKYFDLGDTDQEMQLRPSTIFPSYFVLAINASPGR